MEKMINLRHLLMHEVQDLYSAEEQILEALPSMIEKARNKQLKDALQRHLKVTEHQKERLDEVKELLMGGMEDGERENGKGNGEKKGILANIFGSGKQKCRGMEGLIEEGEKVMGEEMSPEVLDAAIIASAQKIEHYEICGYGTARAYARELNLGDVAELLEETLDEEYEADDLLTDLAVGRLNEEAETGGTRGGGRSNGDSDSGRSGGKTSAGGARTTAGRGSKSGGSNGGRSASKSSSGGSRSASKSSTGGSRSASKSNTGGSRSASKSSSASSRSGSKSAAASKSASGGSRSGSSASRGGRSGSTASGGSRSGATASRGGGSRGKASSKGRK